MWLGLTFDLQPLQGDFLPVAMAVGEDGGPGGGLFDGGEAYGRGAVHVAAVPVVVWFTPTAQLGIEVAPEAFAEQVEGKGVDARAGEAEDSCQ